MPSPFERAAIAGVRAFPQRFGAIDHSLHIAAHICLSAAARSVFSVPAKFSALSDIAFPCRRPFSDPCFDCSPGIGDFSPFFGDRVPAVLGVSLAARLGESDFVFSQNISIPRPGTLGVPPSGFGGWRTASQCGPKEGGSRGRVATGWGGHRLERTDRSGGTDGREQAGRGGRGGRARGSRGKGALIGVRETKCKRPTPGGKNGKEGPGEAGVAFPGTGQPTGRARDRAEWARGQRFSG
jgi:hypothetical protein